MLAWIWTACLTIVCHCLERLSPRVGLRVASNFGTDCNPLSTRCFQGLWFMDHVAAVRFRAVWWGGGSWSSACSEISKAQLLLLQSQKRHCRNVLSAKVCFIKVPRSRFQAASSPEAREEGSTLFFLAVQRTMCCLLSLFSRVSRGKSKVREARIS